MKLTNHEWLRAGKFMELLLAVVCLMGMELGSSASAQAISTTTVQGTVYLANGLPGTGTVVVSWPSFTTASGQLVAADSITAPIAPDGFLSVNLAPNLGATPAGLYYTAVYYLGDGTTSTQYWVVPQGAQATLGQVQSQLMPAVQAVRAVSKAYVDQAIEAVSGSLLTASGGTLSGTLTLSGDPTQPLQAADKHYVDAQTALDLPLTGGSLSGPLTGVKLGALYQADQFPGADFGAKLQACLGALNTSYGGTCDARNFSGNLSMGSNLTIATANATVQLPCATISTANKVIVTAGTRNVSLRGCSLRGASAASGSQGGTVFLYSGTGAMVQVGDPTYATDTQGFHLDNVVINTTASVSSAAQGLAAYRTQEMNLESLYFLGNSNQTGMTLDGTGNYTGGTFLDNSFDGFQTAVNAIGHQIVNPAPTDWLNASMFVRLHIDCPTSGGSPISGTYGINLQSGDGNTITGGDVEGCSTALHMGPNAQNNTIIGLRNENSNSQVVADAGSSYNNWMSGGTMFTGQLIDNGTRNSFLDTFHRSFNSLNGDWYGSQQDATVTNLYRIGIGAGNERGLLDRYQSDSGYRWTMGLSDATAGEQYYQILDELNHVYRISVGQYNNGQSSTNDQTVINAAGTGAVVLNGSNNSGTGGVVIGSGGTSETTVATIDNAGNAQLNGSLQVGGASTFSGTTIVKNLADAEIDSVLQAGATTSQKESFIYRDWNGNSQWYMVKDANNDWALNSATGGLDSFKAFQNTNSGDTYVNASNSSGVIRFNYENGSGTGLKVYGGNSSTLYAGFTGTAAIQFPGLAASSGHNCVQVDNSGYISNTGSSCGSGSGSGTVSTGSIGQIAYYSGNGATVSGTSTVPVSAGGTGSSTASGAIANLGAVALTGGTLTGALTAPQFNGALTGNVTGNVSGTALNVTGTVLVGNGGTGATTSAGAIANLLPGVTSSGGNGVTVAGNTQLNGTIQVGGTSTFAGTTTVKNQSDTEIDSILQAGATTGQKESFIYKDWNGNNQWYMVKDAGNNWSLNSATGGLDSFKAYQSTNSGDTYINSSNASGVVRVNYESGAGSAFNIYGGGSSNLFASFTGAAAIRFPGLAASSGHNCVQIDNSGYLTNTGAACGTGSTNGTVNAGTTGQIAFYGGSGTALSGINTVSISAGGTGASTASSALANLGGAAITGGTFTGPISMASTLSVANNASIGPRYDVTNAVFGAKGDGSTDDTLAIQAAFNACNNGGVIPYGGVVEFPGDHTYVISSTINAYDSCQIEGVVGSSSTPNSPPRILWNGPTAGAVSTITSFSITSNVVTFTAANNLTAGQWVEIQSLTAGYFLNRTIAQVLSTGLSNSQFEMTLPPGWNNVTTTFDSGTATTVNVVIAFDSIARYEQSVSNISLLSAGNAQAFNVGFYFGSRVDTGTRVANTWVAGASEYGYYFAAGGINVDFDKGWRADGSGVSGIYWRVTGSDSFGIANGTVDNNRSANGSTTSGGAVMFDNAACSNNTGVHFTSRNMKIEINSSLTPGLGAFTMYDCPSNPNMESFWLDLENTWVAPSSTTAPGFNFPSFVMSPANDAAISLSIVNGGFPSGVSPNTTTRWVGIPELLRTDTYGTNGWVPLLSYAPSTNSYGSNASTKSPISLIGDVNIGQLWQNGIQASDLLYSDIAFSALPNGTTLFSGQILAPPGYWSGANGKRYALDVVYQTGTTGIPNGGSTTCTGTINTSVLTCTSAADMSEGQRITVGTDTNKAINFVDATNPNAVIVNLTSSLNATHATATALTFSAPLLGSEIQMPTKSAGAPSSLAWSQGDMEENSTATANGVAAWVNVAAGTPGTWAGIPLGNSSGQIATSQISNTTGSGSAVLATSPTVASPTFTGTVTSPLSTAGVVTTTSGGVLGSEALVPVAQGGTGASTAGGALTALGGAPVVSPTFTGTVTIPAGASITGFAPLASPTFTGSPTVPGYLTTASATSTYATKASPTFTGTVTTPLSTAGVVTTTSGGVLGSVAQVPAANGGLGAASLTGYLYGNGSSAATASTTIPVSALAATVGSGSVVLSSGVTGSGSAVLATSPTMSGLTSTGTTSLTSLNVSGGTILGNVTLNGSCTGTGCAQTNTPSWLTYLGTGADGSYEATAASCTQASPCNLSGEKFYTSFQVDAGAYVYNNVASAGSGLVIHSQGACNIYGTILNSGFKSTWPSTNKGVGGGTSGGSGGGSSAGSAGTATFPSIIGSGLGNINGGAAGASSGGNGAIGSIFSTASQRAITDANGGGLDGLFLTGSTGVQGGNSGGVGGFPGGGLVLECGSINGTGGVIDVSGANGMPPSANSTGAGSGGGGGVALLSSQATVTTWPSVYVAGGPGALVTVPQTLAISGSCTTQPKATLGVTSGALSSCTVVQAGSGCGTGANVTFNIVGGGGTGGSITPTWSGGALASCTATGGSGYTAASYTTSGTGGDGGSGWFTEFQGW